MTKYEKEKEPDYENKIESSRRNFIKTAVATTLGGILIGKTALAEGLERIAETGESEGIKKVTEGYEGSYIEENQRCYPRCNPLCRMCRPIYCYPKKCGPDEPPCFPNCTPGPCRPNCTPRPCDPCNPWTEK